MRVDFVVMVETGGNRVMEGIRMIAWVLIVCASEIAAK